MSLGGGVVKAFGVTLAANLTASIVSLLSITLTVRTLSPGEWANAATVLGVGQFLGALLNFGSSVERVRLYSRTTDGEAARTMMHRDLATRIICSIILTGLGFLVLGLSATAAAIGWVAAGTFISLGAASYLIAKKRFVIAGLATVAEKVLSLLVVMIAIAHRDQFSSLTLPVAYALGSGLIGSLGFVFFCSPRRTLANYSLARGAVNLWLGCRYFGPSSVAPSVLLLDVFLVRLLSDANQAGYFAVASRLVAPLSLASSAVVSVIFPYLAPQQRRIPRQALKSFVILGTTMLTGFVIMSATAPQWLSAFFGDQYNQSVWPVRFYVVNALLVLFTRTLVATLQVWGYERFTARAVALQVLAAVLGIGMGASLDGAAGAALGVVLTNACLLLALAAKLRRH